MELYIKGERPVLVLSTNKTETQTITKSLYSLKSTSRKYILEGRSHQEKIDRYTECLLEDDPETYEIVFDWLDAAHGLQKPKYSRQLLGVQQSIVRWINQALTDGYNVTWHNE